LATISIVVSLTTYLPIRNAFKNKNCFIPEPENCHRQ
jgi:hypothetical protein